MPQYLGYGNPQQGADDPEDFRFGAAGGRLGYSSSSEIEYAIYSSNVLEVNGINVGLEPAGASTLICTSTDDLIDAAGDSTASPPGSGTRYYAYVCNGADGLGVRLRLSLEPPAYVKGIYYLGTTGNAVNWRFVGTVALLGGVFRDDVTARLIANHANRLRKPLFTCPGYTDDNADTTIVLASGTVWAALNGGTGDSVAFLSNGEDCVELVGNVQVALGGGATWRVGIGVDSVLANAQAEARVAAACRNNQTQQPSTVVLHETFVDALYFASLNAYTNSTTPSVIADFARTGDTVDPPGTTLSGSVWV